jgi:hypothetical protein
MCLNRYANDQNIKQFQPSDNIFQLSDIKQLLQSNYNYRINRSVAGSEKHVYECQDLRILRRWLWRMPSYQILRPLVLVRTDISEERSASIIRKTRIGELGTTLVVTSNWRTVILVALDNGGATSSETSVLSRATRRNIPEDGIVLYCIVLYCIYFELHQILVLLREQVTNHRI